MSNYKQKSKAKQENQNFDNSTYYGMSLEPVYIGGANEEKLNAFSTQVNLLKQKGFHDEANQLKQDSDQYGIDQALYNLVLKADKQKQQRRVNENQQAIREGTGEVAKNILPVLSMMPGVDTFSDLGYTVADAVKGNWKGVGIGLAAAAIPGVSYGVYKRYPLVKQQYKNYRLIKAFEKSIDERIKINNSALKRDGYFNYKNQIVPTAGLPDPDPDTFYHYGDFTKGDLAPLRGGFVKIKDGNIVPVKNYIIKGYDRIWWDKGHVPDGSPIILATKSSAVDEKVLDHLDKYLDYGAYTPSYYTSGPIPINEIQIYRRNSFTGHYETGIKAPQQPNFLKITRIKNKGGK